MTKTISFRCQKCGTILKSGKRSCCGRGGSWFRNCGSASDAKFLHTWYDGIQSCKKQAHFKTGSAQQSNTAQKLNSRNGFGTANSKSVISDTQTLAFTSDNNSTPMSSTGPRTDPVVVVGTILIYCVVLFLD